MWNRDSPVSVVLLQCDPDVIDHFCGLVWGGLHPEPSLSPLANNVIIPLDLTQLLCPVFTLAAGPPSGFTTTESDAGGEPCGEPAISLHSHHVSLVQWTARLLLVTRDPGSNPKGGTYVNPGFSCLRCLATALWFLTACINPLSTPLQTHPASRTFTIDFNKQIICKKYFKSIDLVFRAKNWLKIFHEKTF